MVATSDTLVRVRSHRAAKALGRLLQRPLEWHYTMHDGGCFVMVRSDEADAACDLPSVTRARPVGDVRKCHPW